MKTKSYSDGQTAPVTYTYDTSETSATPNYPIGRLSQVSTAALNSLPATTETYVQYDANGRVLASQQTIGSQAPFNFAYTYNNQSLENETYPSGRAVQTCYDSAARPTQVTGTSVGGSVQYANLAYTLSGGTIQTTNTMGNSLVETDTTNTRLQMANIQLGTSAGSGGVMSLAFNYGSTNNNGNLLSQTIMRGSSSWVQSYSYDSLNRIACANENPSTAVACAASTGNWSRTFGYDPWANGFVTSNSSTLSLNSFTPTVPTNFNGSNQLNYQGATYLAGNQTAIGGYGFTYDAENRMTSSKINSTTTDYVYDGNGNRVMKSTGTAATTYVYDAMDQLIAEYGTPTAPDTGTKYVSVDHLGSTRLVTDTMQNQEICYDFLPFGELIPTGTDGRSGCYSSTATPLTQKFTGKERDVETNNDFFQARYMSAFQMRFTSSDPLGNFVADPTNPQSWNLYSYVWDSPLALIDPSGLATMNLTSVSDIYTVGNCSYVDMTYGEGDSAVTQTMNVGYCGPTGQQTYSATRIPPSGPTFGTPVIRSSGHPAPNGAKPTFSQCMATHANDFSLAGGFESGINALTGTHTRFRDNLLVGALGGNSITTLLYGGVGENAAGTAASAVGLAGSGVGSGLSYGRRTTDLISLNLPGKGGLPLALGSASATGAAIKNAGKVLGLGLGFTDKLAIDAGLALLEAAYCNDTTN